MYNTIGSFFLIVLSSNVPGIPLGYLEYPKPVSLTAGFLESPLTMEHGLLIYKRTPGSGGARL